VTSSCLRYTKSTYSTFRFGLELSNIYTKVVLNHRGGFCYELNNLFNWLLQELGYNSWTIAARIIQDSGALGPAFDHMAICVETKGGKYLADVGYGDLFIRPLRIMDGIQTDGRSLFSIQALEDDSFYQCRMRTAFRLNTSSV
jgi:N-hydroxyarylamine O-acetyltransferase